MSIWDAVREALQRGEIPAINLTYNMLKIPEPKRRGRPRKPRPEPTLLDKHAAPLLGDKARPRCANPNCRTRLRANQKHTCNDECRKIAIMHYQAVVDLLKNQELPVEDVPDVSDPKTYTRRVLLDGATERELQGSLGGKRKGGKARDKTR